MSMPLRYLIDSELKKAIDIPQPNGTLIHDYESVDKYRVHFYELYDDVSANVYGASLNKMYRITSPNRKLERFLEPKVNTTDDNISNYFIFIKERKYRIVSVKINWIDVELL